MGNHLIQSGVRVLRLLDAHDLDLVELMQTVQTSHVLAVRTGLTTEARSVGGHLLREVVVTKDDISEYVGDRNLGCRDEIEVIKTYIVHLGLLVRQLTGTETGSGVDHDRRLDLLVAGGGVDVKEINPKTMQSKIIDNLYFAGEVIDVDAYTGGFNLQVAFSTGYLCGMNI